eukprot:2330251-Pleurochrysis_carterae.AAC.1
MPEKWLWIFSQPVLRTLHAMLHTYPPIHTTRLCMGADETCEEIGARSHDGPLLDGWSPRQFARQNGGAVCMVPFLTLSRRPTYAWAHEPCAHVRPSH